MGTAIPPLGCKAWLTADTRPVAVNGMVVCRKPGCDWGGRRRLGETREKRAQRNTWVNESKVADAESRARRPRTRRARSYQEDLAECICNTLSSVAPFTAGDFLRFSSFHRSPWPVRRFPFADTPMGNPNLWRAVRFSPFFPFRLPHVLSSGRALSIPHCSPHTHTDSSLLPSPLSPRPLSLLFLLSSRSLASGCRRFATPQNLTTRLQRNSGRFDEIWVLPVYQHMFSAKRTAMADKGAPTYEDRIEMCRCVRCLPPWVVYQLPTPHTRYP